MAADHLPAFRAAPLLRFLCQEAFDAVFFDDSEILNHAHVEFRPVTFVQALQPPAGKGLALKAKPDVALSQQCTLLTDVGAVFSSWDTPRAVFSAKTLLVQVLFPELIGNTQTAVHPTWCDECFVDRECTFLRPLEYGSQGSPDLAA